MRFGAIGSVRAAERRAGGGTAPASCPAEPSGAGAGVRLWVRLAARPFSGVASCGGWTRSQLGGHSPPSQARAFQRQRGRLGPVRAAHARVRGRGGTAHVRAHEIAEEEGSSIDRVETDSYRKRIMYASTDLVLNIFPCLDAVPSTGVLAVNMYTFIGQGIYIKFQSVSCPPPPGSALPRARFCTSLVTP